MLDVIYTRRSVRYFKPDPIRPEDLAEILRAGMWAPSPKNRQPWRFLVYSGTSKGKLLTVLADGIQKSARGEGLLATPDGYIENAKFTLRAMADAPVTVIVTNPLGRSVYADWSAAEKINELSNVQSIGAAAENMALAATALGIGSLWNGNIFYAYDELREFLAGKGEPVLAMSFGYAAKDNLRPLPRKQEEDVIVYENRIEN